MSAISTEVARLRSLLVLLLRGVWVRKPERQVLGFRACTADPFSRSVAVGTRTEPGATELCLSRGQNHMLQGTDSSQVSDATLYS